MKYRLMIKERTTRNISKHRVTVIFAARRDTSASWKSQLEIENQRKRWIKLTILLPCPTTNLCLPIQLLGGSLRLCNDTVLLCIREARSYHALAISLFSRWRLANS